MISGEWDLLTLECKDVIYVKLQTLFKMKVYKQNEFLLIKNDKYVNNFT